MKKPVKIILIVSCVVAALMAAVTGLVIFAINIFLDQAKEEISENLVLQSHVGEIESIDFELMKTADAGGDDTFVFTVTGSKASGLVFADFVTLETEEEEMRNGTLTLEDGTSYSLDEE